MGLNFRRSLSIGKLFRINFSKKGLGVSAGVKGARISLNKDGVRETVSLPGTGLSWSERQSFRRAKKTGNADSSGKAGTAVKPGNHGKMKTFIWIVLVAGAFLLYRSGALDSVMNGVWNAFGGGGSNMSAKGNGAQSAGAAALPAATEGQGPGAVALSPVAGNESQTVVLPEGKETAVEAASPQSSAITGGAVELVLKDGTVTLSVDTKYVASKSGAKFHRLDCRIVGSIAKKNLMEYALREEAMAKKEPCSVCNP